MVPGFLGSCKCAQKQFLGWLPWRRRLRLQFPFVIYVCALCFSTLGAGVANLLVSVDEARHYVKGVVGEVKDLNCRQRMWWHMSSTVQSTGHRSLDCTDAKELSTRTPGPPRQEMPSHMIHEWCSSALPVALRPVTHNQTTVNENRVGLDFDVREAQFCGLIVTA